MAGADYGNHPFVIGYLLTVEKQERRTIRNIGQRFGIFRGVPE